MARKERKEMNTEFWYGNLKEGDHLYHTGVYGRIILKCISTKSLEWIRLVQARDKRGALVDTVQNIRVP